jgi:hypothetical protein
MKSTETTEATEASSESEPSPRGRRALLAQFADRPSAERAVAALAERGVDARRAELVPRPTRNPLFHGHRLLWGGVGLVAGGAAGFVLGGLAGMLLDVERGLIVSGPYGVVLTSAIIGAIMLGTLGLIGGFGLSEPKATREVTDRAADRDLAPGEVLLRVDVEDAREELVRDVLSDAGAALVTWESASPWNARPALEPRRLEEQPTG